MGRKVTGFGSEVTIYGRSTLVTSYGISSVQAQEHLFQRALLSHLRNR